MEKFRVKLVWSVVFLCFLQTSSSGVSPAKRMEPVELGKCPEYEGVKDFSTSKFQGQWYIGHQFTHKFPPCRVFNFNATSNYTMDIEVDDPMNSRLTVLSNGKSSAEDIGKPAVMTWSYKMQPFFLQKSTIVATDYENYALLMICEDMALFHTKGGIFLTRDELYRKSVKNGTHPYFDKILEAYSRYYQVDDRNRSPENFCELPKGSEAKKLNIGNTISTIMDLINKFI